ncbi:MAG: RasGEF domain-containing protein, partial [archaeon]|nr:RasGEF domain-containing protein [archaeon]
AKELKRKKEEEIKKEEIKEENLIEENKTGNRPEIHNELDLVLKEIKHNEDKIEDKNLFLSLQQQDDKYFVDKLLEYDDTYILDRKDDYVLLYLIKEYVTGSIDPNLSELMQSYNLFVSSIELIFCLKLVLKFPVNPSNESQQNYYNSIYERVKGFCLEWRRVYPKKYANNKLIQCLISDFGEVRETQGIHNNVDYITLSLEEPILTPKYVSFIKLIREGPFFYEIEEIARQMCLIDHSFFSSIPQKDYIDYIVKKEIPDSFNRIYKREKHFKCYILMFLLLIRNLENQKNAIQNFIWLAHQCKLLNNFQTEYTIISTFAAIGISKKELLWRLIEKKYRDIYQALESEFLDVDLNEKTIDQFKKGGDFFIPHIDLVRNQINNFIIQIKMSGEEQKVRLCTEYRDFYSKIVNFNNNRYSFFVVNPLHDFLKSGFWEICKNKHWGIKAKYDFSSYSDSESDAERLLDILVKLYKKKDKTIV